MSARPYDSIGDHLRDELAWLDRTLELAIERFRRPSRPAEFEQFGGLILGEKEVLDGLRAPLDRSLRPDGRAATEWRRQRQLIDERTDATRAVGRYLPLLYLRDVLELEDFEERCLLLALASELDRKYERALVWASSNRSRLVGVVVAHGRIEGDEPWSWIPVTGLGWEVGAGLGFEMGSGWHLAPGARFRFLSRDLTIGNIETNVDLSYVTAGIAFSRRRF